MERTAKMPLLHGNSVEQKRQELKSYFISTYERYESLFACIKNEKAYYLRPEPLRHPLIFYLGHTAAFYINKLILGHCIHQRVNETFESILAIGVDEMSWDDLDNHHYDWPAVNDMFDYRKAVRHIIEQVIDTMPLNLPIEIDSAAWIILMAIEHENIHIETSSVLIRMLPLSHLQNTERWSACKEIGAAPVNQLIPVKGQTIRLGRGEPCGDIYGWDNEYGFQDEDVADFHAAKFLVSNQEFLNFIEDGGYRNPSLWTNEGRRWLAYSKALMPHFWRHDGHQYWQRNMLEEIPLPLNWPVEVNYHEANAFCTWKSKTSHTHIRLPSEAEWAILRNRVNSDLPHWERAPGNINLEYFASSCPINKFAHDDFYDVVGNVWQWTDTPIDGYPGFTVDKLYDDFSTPTFDGQHNLIKGGSWISTGNLATQHARYAFRRHFFQHAGFRYIQSQSAKRPAVKVNPYEKDIYVSQYLEFHYGNEYFAIPNFLVTCINHCMRWCNQQPRFKALDLGCSVGRASFELAKYYDHVDGIDFSARFVQQGIKLQEDGNIKYVIATEGDLVDYQEASLKVLGYEKLSHKVTFIQGDACNLKANFKDYNLIFCGNLIDRLYDPALFLELIKSRLAPQGILVLTSPYTWLEEYTEKDKWLGGKRVNGEMLTTLDGLKLALTPQFELLEVLDVPFVLRETERKFQHTIAQMTIWQLSDD